VLSQLVGPDDNLLVLSDHGMQANFRGNHLAEPILEKLGLLVRKGNRQERAHANRRRHVTDLGAARWMRNPRLRRLMPRAVKPMLRKLLDLPRVDWARTQVFVLPTDRNTYIRVNLKGREPNGQVAPGPAYERLLDYLERELRALVNVATGEPAVSDVIRLHTVYPGECVEDLPDIAVLWSANAPLDAVASPAVGVVSRRIRELRSGNHREEGFLLARGPAFRAGRARFAGDVLQIAPTLLQLCGVEQPSQFEQGPFAFMLEREAIRAGSG
jgi:predicted AlkP superfamily phosphohydrolase/phosphomutase